MPGPNRTSAVLPSCALLFALACVPSSVSMAQIAAPQTASDVHPITSLPKAPSAVADTATIPAYAIASLPPRRAALSMASVAEAPAALAVSSSAVTAPVADAPAFSPEAAVPAAAPATSPAPAVSSSQPAEAPQALHSVALHAMLAPAPAPSPQPNRVYRPFSAFAVAVKIGTAGIGLDLATPLAQRFNLRGGASFFQYSGSYDVDGTNISGEAKLRSVNMSVDWFPFNNRFRISPGVILYNGNNLNATASVPGGQTFELNDTTYTSSASDPIHGSASMTFGNRTAPSITIGAGNMIPRHGGHLSLPFEVGIEYISDPMLTLALQGSACSQGVCQSVSTNPQFQSNLQAENNELNSDIHPLRFFPILSLGLAYKF